MSESGFKTGWGVFKASAGLFTTSLGVAVATAGGAVAALAAANRWFTDGGLREDVLLGALLGVAVLWTVYGFSVASATARLMWRSMQDTLREGDLSARLEEARHRVRRLEEEARLARDVVRHGEEMLQVANEYDAARRYEHEEDLLATGDRLSTMVAALGTAEQLAPLRGIPEEIEPIVDEATVPEETTESTDEA